MAQRIVVPRGVLYFLWLRRTSSNGRLHAPSLCNIIYTTSTLLYIVRSSLLSPMTACSKLAPRSTCTIISIIFVRRGTQKLTHKAQVPPQKSRSTPYPQKFLTAACSSSHPISSLAYILPRPHLSCFCTYRISDLPNRIPSRQPRQTHAQSTCQVQETLEQAVRVL